jgi:hypothetical protein
MAPAGVVAPAGGAHQPDAFSDVLLGALVHDVNLAHGVLDRLGHEVVRVADAAAGPAAATATVELSGGARWSMAWLLEPAAGEFTEELLACTTAGVHRLSFPAPYQRPSAATHLHTAGGAGRWTATASRGYADAYARQLEHFHACATAGAACRTPVAQARRDIALLTDLLHAGAAA